MKIGIISDSHYNLKSIDDAIFLADDVNCWFHAGDSIEDAEYLEEVSGKKVYKVCGNVDWFSDEADELLAEIENIRVFLTHGHNYRVKWTLDSLNRRALELNADLIIYGHSHVGAKDIIENKIFVNPGSVSQPRDGLPPSFMKAVINGSDIEIERIFLNKKF